MIHLFHQSSHNAQGLRLVASSKMVPEKSMADLRCISQRDYFTFTNG